jgi:hypothetical protein
MSEETGTSAAPAKGTKNLIEVVDLALGLLEAGTGAMKDGKLGIDDLLQLKSLVTVVGPAIGDVGEVPGELADLTTEEAAEVVGHVMLKLAIDDAKARAVVAASLKLAVAGYELFKAVKS